MALRSAECKFEVKALSEGRGCPGLAGRVRVQFMRISTQRVRELRHAQTEAEKAAWHLLRDRRLGMKFRRQYPIENYVVDFYCCERRLAIELDGGVHSEASQIRKDKARDAFLERLGILVLRLPNGLVTEDPESFVRTVRDAAAARWGLDLK